MNPERIITKLRKNAQTEVWVVVAIFEGRPTCHVREHFKPDDSAVWLPTKRGASIAQANLGGVVDAVEKLPSAKGVGPVCEIPLGSRSKLSIGHKEIDGHRYAEIRVYYQKPNEPLWRHGKGVTIPLKHLEDLAAALRTAEDELEELVKAGGE